MCLYTAITAHKEAITKEITSKLLSQSNQPWRKIKQQIVKTRQETRLPSPLTAAGRDVRINT